MKKLLLLALIPLIGIKRTQAAENGFKNIYDQIASYYFTFTPQQQAAITAGFVFAHGLGYVLGKKIRSYCDIKNKRVITVHDQQGAPNIVDTKLNKKWERAMLRDTLIDLELANSHDDEQELQGRLGSYGWACHFDKDLQKFIAYQEGSDRNYYAEIKDNKMGWGLYSYKDATQLEEARKSKKKQRVESKNKFDELKKDQEKQLKENLKKMEMAKANRSLQFKKAGPHKPIFNAAAYYKANFKAGPYSMSFPQSEQVD